MITSQRSVKSLAGCCLRGLVRTEFRWVQSELTDEMNLSGSLAYEVLGRDRTTKKRTCKSFPLPASTRESVRHEWRIRRERIRRRETDSCDKERAKEENIVPSGQSTILLIHHVPHSVLLRITRLINTSVLPTRLIQDLTFR